MADGFGAGAECRPPAGARQVTGASAGRSSSPAASRPSPRGFAPTNAPGLNQALALLWGLAIMGIDRCLITSIPPRGSRRWIVAITRLLFVLLLSSW
ncbi:MAG: hypothetical protein ACRDPY_48530, partial [Streptosporangiaceae bacterium]